MYAALQLPWSQNPSTAEAAYRDAGLVKTKGTIYILPPNEKTLRNAFARPPRSRSRMSSGANALCKHFERGGASSERSVLHPFWPLPTGSNDNKSAIAASVLDKIFEEAIWKNVMLLHTGVVIYEIRNGKGYGMRWTLDLHREDMGASSSSEVHENDYILIASHRYDTDLEGNFSRLQKFNSEQYYNELQAAFDTFNKVNSPKIPACLGSAAAKAQTQRLSESVFESWNTLRAILGKREDILRKRWTKKTNKQRIKILRATWPDISLDHRPDFHVTRLEGKLGVQLPVEHEHALKWPYINIEDLVSGRNMLLLLNSRGSVYPEAFAHADFEATHYGRIFRKIDPEFLNGYTVYLTRCKTPSTYGQIIPWRDNERAYDRMMDQTQFSFGDGIVVLEVQNALYKSLLKFCCHMFQDVATSDITGAMMPTLPRLPPPIVNDDLYVQMSTIVSETPYRSPLSLDPRRLRLVIEARHAAAVDHFWDLREDPVYFMGVTTDWIFHWKPSGGAGEAYTKSQDKRLTHLITHLTVEDAFDQVSVFGHLNRQISEVETLYKRTFDRDLAPETLPRDLENILLDMILFLEFTIGIRLTSLKNAIAVSPGFRDFYQCYVGGEKSLKIPEMIVRPKARSKTDQLLSLMNILFDDKKLSILRLAVVFDEIQRCFDGDVSQSQRMSEYSMRSFGDIGLLIQLKHQIDVFYPWSAGFAAKLQGCQCDGTKQCEPMKHLSEYVRDSKETTGLLKDATALAALAAPLRDGFRYPCGNRKSEADTKTMQEAEGHLDAFWKKVDDIYSAKSGKPIHEFLISKGFEIRNIIRTPDWIPPVKDKAPDVSSLSISCPLDDSISNLPEKAPGRMIPEPQRQKLKTKGVPEPLKAGKKPGIRKAMDALQESPLPQAQVPKVFIVSNRVHKVASSLFFSTTESEQAPGEMPWKDFVYTMTAIGFGAEKRYGSVWQFTPTKMGVEVGIQFHEPHPSGKIRWEVARRMGRRLTKSYGLTAESFTLA